MRTHLAQDDDERLSFHSYKLFSHSQAAALTAAGQISSKQGGTTQYQQNTATEQQNTATEQ